MDEYRHVAILAVVLSALLTASITIPAIPSPAIAFGTVGTQFTEGTTLFVGDIMLGRAVERIMEEKGISYPFDRTRALTTKADLAVGNFEASAPKDHTPTPNFGFSLSVRPEYFTAIASAGFDMLSLANNHSMDFGEAAYANTRTVCSDVGIECRGSQSNDPNIAIATTTIGSTRVGVVFLDDVNTPVTLATFSKPLRDLQNATDVTFAYIHWGTEYKDTHSGAQEKLAHALIDHGFDAVIGSHPHVVEDIELYRGKPIFYSLGNFIFDQYFNDTVQQGLAVEVTFTKDQTIYTLVPVSSMGTKSQPHLLNVDDSRAYINALLTRSGIESVDGRITVLRT